MKTITPGPWFRLSGGAISNTVGADWADERHFVCGIDCDNDANAKLIVAAPDLLAACEAAEKGIRDEWLYQTGQTVRPAQQYPTPGSVCGGLHDALMVIKAAIAKAKGTT